MSAPQVSRWSRRFVAAGALFFVAWAVAALLGLGRRLEVVLVLYGFVLHTVFGKSYALIPSYFDRSLSVPRAPAVQFPLSALGVTALAAGSDELVAASVGLPTVLGGALPRISHLLGVGGATLLVFAVGFRLFPRFLVAHPPESLVALVLLTGSLGPALLAVGLYEESLLLAGAAVEGIAIFGFAVAYVVLYRRSDRDRVGLHIVLVAVFAGVVAVAVAGHLAVAGRSAALVERHYRFAVAGFLGLTIVGAAVQFYPPSVGQWPGSSDRTALAVVALVSGGLAVQILGLVVGLATVVGELLVLTGTVGYAYLLASAFVAR